MRLSVQNLINVLLKQPSLVTALHVSMAFGGLLSSCLPVDVDQPECYPQEGCPFNLKCDDGRCVEPSLKSLRFNLECLGRFGCDESLRDLQISQSCLIIEQPSALLSIPFSFNQASSEEIELLLPLLDAPLRASVVMLRSLEEEARSSMICPLDSAAIMSTNLHRECKRDQGCLLRLRSPHLTKDRVAQEGPLRLSFNGPDGQCFESSWSAEAPLERCGGGDFDCDGFIDEGLLCGGEE